MADCCHSSFERNERLISTVNDIIDVYSGYFNVHHVCLQRNVDLSLFP